MTQRATLRAGFAEADISPPAGTAKIGALRVHAGTKVADPLAARVALFDDGVAPVAIVALDTLSVGRAHAAEIRRVLAQTAGVPGERVLVAATHTHGGAAVVRCGAVPADRGYVAQVTRAVERAAAAAAAGLQPAAVGVARTVEFDVARNRRVVRRDGTVRTHGHFGEPDALWIEGPIDPELHVIAARAVSGEWLGCLVAYACHPTDHGDDLLFSAGFPGVLAAELRATGMPVTLFLNGALGNVHPADPARGGAMPDMHAVGRILAGRVSELLADMAVGPRLALHAATVGVELPFRELDAAETTGRARGAQRYAGAGPEPAEWPALYDAMIADVRREVAAEGAQAAEVQALGLGAHALVGIPAELFCELGLEIKERAAPRPVIVAGLANGMVGYVPTAAAFARGGYETTLSTVSKLAPAAGDLLVDAAERAIGRLPDAGVPA